MENPFVKPTDVQLVQPKRPDEGGGVVVLERIEPGVTPEYCIHGQVTCQFCPEWCWLGSETYKIVMSGEVAPMCLQCATRILGPTDAKPTRNLNDHRRADGPHD